MISSLRKSALLKFVVSGSERTIVSGGEGEVPSLKTGTHKNNWSALELKFPNSVLHLTIQGSGTYFASLRSKRKICPCLGRYVFGEEHGI